MLRIRSPRDGVEFAVFEFGSLPSPQDLATIRSERLGLRLASLPRETPDLSFLSPFADFLTRLDISAAGTPDARAIENLRHLEQLSYTGGVAGPVDLSKLKTLSSYFGLHKHFESLSGCPNLVELTLYPAVPQAVPPIVGLLQSLSIVHTTRLSEVPVITHPDHLRVLSIDGPKSLHLGRLPAYSSLRLLELTSIGLVESVQAIQELPVLETVAFVGCRGVDSEAALLNVEHVEFSVYGRHGFSPEFVGRAKARPNWTFA